MIQKNKKTMIKEKGKEICQRVLDTNHKILHPCQLPLLCAIINPRKTKIKGGEIVVELDQFKVTLNSYAEPLVEVRDSL